MIKGVEMADFAYKTGSGNNGDVRVELAGIGYDAAHSHRIGDGNGNDAGLGYAKAFQNDRLDSIAVGNGLFAAEALHCLGIHLENGVGKIVVLCCLYQLLSGETKAYDDAVILETPVLVLLFHLGLGLALFLHNGTDLPCSCWGAGYEGRGEHHGDDAHSQKELMCLIAHEA